MSLGIYLILTFGMMFIGVPVAISLGLPSIIYLLINNIAVTTLIERMGTGMNSATLLCIPFFILAGEIMGKGGIAKRLIDLAKSVLGGVTGGLAYIAIICCAFFAAVTGSGIACCIAMGSILIPDMMKSGYSRAFSTTVVTTGSILGPVIPPSISLVVYGSLTGASIANLYAEGIPAGIIMALSMCLLIYFKCKRNRFNEFTQPETADKETISSLKPAFLPSLYRSILAIGTPVIILGGILGGIVTPMEASVISVVYSLLVCMIVYREIRIKDLPRLIYDSVMSTAKIYLIIAAATIFAWILTYENLPQTVMKLLLSLTDKRLVMLLIFNVVFLIMGMFMEPSSMYVIAVPIFLPILKVMNIDLVYFGVVLSVNSAIGLITPPFGTVLFSGSSVGKTPIHQILQQMWPFILMQIFVLLLITYVPGLITWMSFR